MREISIEIGGYDGFEVLNKRVVDDFEEDMLIEAIDIDLDNEGRGRYINDVFYN